MCNRCTQSWIPTNHRASHGWHRIGDRFHWERIHAIRNPLAEMRRTARWGDNDRIGTKYGPSLRQTSERLARRTT